MWTKSIYSIRKRLLIISCLYIFKTVKMNMYRTKTQINEQYRRFQRGGEERDYQGEKREGDGECRGFFCRIIWGPSKSLSHCLIDRNAPSAHGRLNGGVEKAWAWALGPHIKKALNFKVQYFTIDQKLKWKLGVSSPIRICLEISPAKKLIRG